MPRDYLAEKQICSLLQIFVRARFALLAPVARPGAGLRGAQGAGSRARAPSSGIGALHGSAPVHRVFFHSGHMFR